MWTFQYRYPQTEDGWRTSTRDWPDAEHAAAAVAQMQAICAVVGAIVECRLHELGQTYAMTTERPTWEPTGSYEPTPDTLPKTTDYNMPVITQLDE